MSLKIAAEMYVSHFIFYDSPLGTKEKTTESTLADDKTSQERSFKSAP